VRRLSLLTVVAALVAGPASAQDDRPRPHPGATADFFFGEPRGSIALRGGWVFARAGSDLFDFVRDQLTVDGGDFNAPAMGGEVGVSITPRLDAVAGVDTSRSQTSSEYRDFIGSDALPISQTTKLRTVGVSGSIRLWLTPRGRSVSRLAWIPRGVTPYIGAGGGAVHYDFVQTGDFVDFVDLSVFSDVFQSKGWAPSGHVFAGVDLQAYRRLRVQFEGRYLWAAGTLDNDFVGFDPIDLAGFRTTAGISILF
jgi:opacity protein-like surface antigen